MKVIKHRTTVILVLLLISVAGNIFLYNKVQRAQNNNPDVQTQRIVDRLEKMTSLPKDEKPSVLTVVDKKKLADSAIAQNAENGDKILLYQKAGKVYIYRPQDDKLVTILNLTAQTQKETKSPSAPSDTGTTPATSQP